MQTELIFSREDSPASPTAQPGNGKAKKMIATSGPKCLESLEKFSLVGSWVKMFSACLIGQEGWYSTKFKLTWKLRGSSFSRMYFQLAASTLRTEETEFGLLHTPSTQEPGVSVQRLVTKEGEPAKVGERAYDKHTGRLAQVGLIQQ